MELSATITCPHCGTQRTMTMPIDYCLVVFDCDTCHAQLRPRRGDCCVFCTYGSLPCPSQQRQQGHDALR